MGWILTRKLRVLHLDHTNARGGAEYALLRMLEAVTPWSGSVLIPQNEASTNGVFEPLVAPAWVQIRRCGPAQRFGASSSTRSRLSVFGFALRAIGQSVAIRTSIEFRKADVVHANTSRSAVYGAVACFGSRKKLVVHLRDMVDEVSLGRVGFRLLTKVGLRRADGVIANSNATLESARPYLHAGRPVVVIASAAGLRICDAAPVGSGIVRRVGMVARLDPWKGQVLLLNAFATAFGGSDVRLLLAGGAPFGNESYEAELRDLAVRLGIEAQVDFLGHVDDVPELISSLDICVQASVRPEPLGQNVLQYLAQGRVTVAVDAGGPAEWIRSGDNGLLFPIGDQDALAQALARLSEDGGLRVRLAAAALKTPGLATDEEIAADHFALFELVGTGQRRESSIAKVAK